MVCCILALSRACAFGARGLLGVVLVLLALASAPSFASGADPFTPAEQTATRSVGDTSGLTAKLVSELGNTGTFVAPELKPTPRPAFGANAGRAEPSSLSHFETPPSTLVTAFWILTAFAGFVTAFAAWRLARLRKPDGTVARGFTLGSKLTLAFGSLGCMILVVSTMSLKSQHSAEAATSEFEEMIQDVAASEEIMLDLYRAQVRVRDFMLDPSDRALASYSDAMARSVASVEGLSKVMTDPSSARILSEVREHVNQYDKGFARLVAVLDEEHAILEYQLAPTAERIVALLRAIRDTARADGDAQIAFAAGDKIETILLAHIELERYVVTRDANHARLATELARRSARDAAELRASMRNPVRQRWAAEIEQGANFFATGIDRVTAASQNRARVLAEQIDRPGDAAIANGYELVKLINEREHELKARLASEAELIRAEVLIISAFALLTATFVSVLLIRVVTRGVSRVLSVLQSVAAGDLTREALKLKSSDEIGELARATDSMNESLKQIMADVSTSAGGVASAATEIAASNEEMSAGLAEQADQVSQVSAATEEMSATSQEVANKSTEGKGVVEQTISRIEEIASEVRASAAAVNSLGQKSEEIGQIISVINDIADQTNLLALNAAIEAARAGEHGRGFAVVADEVRQLAERTTKATEQVGQSIREIQQETTGAVQRMEGGTEKVAAGVEYAKQAGDALSSIVTAAEQQSSATIEIAQSVEQINSVALQSREGAAQAAAAAAQLSAEAEKLQSLVKKFKV
ncbi:MAG: HAMP domain-containing protein [Phycisphaeraceae bacterium]|nr:HAMP domain-containing protein [Phycisphaeraceae bacterium]